VLASLPEIVKRDIQYFSEKTRVRDMRASSAAWNHSHAGAGIGNPPDFSEKSNLLYPVRFGSWHTLPLPAKILHFIVSFENGTDFEAQSMFLREKIPLLQSN